MMQYGVLQNKMQQPAITSQNLLILFWLCSLYQLTTHISHQLRLPLLLTQEEARSKKFDSAKWEPTNRNPPKPLASHTKAGCQKFLFGDWQESGRNDLRQPDRNLKVKFGSSSKFLRSMWPPQAHCGAAAGIINCQVQGSQSPKATYLNYTSVDLPHIKKFQNPTTLNPCWLLVAAKSHHQQCQVCII